MADLPLLPDTPFYAAVLRGIGAPVTGNTLALLYAWRQAEGASATYNPFNTTLKRPGSTLFGKNPHGVQNYRLPGDGVDATVRTLLAYPDIVAALVADKPAADVARVITASRWGTGPLLLDVVAMFGRGRFVVAPIATVPGAPPIASLTPAAAASAPPRKPAPPPFLSGWRVWALGAAAAIVFIGIPAVLLARPALPRLPAPPKSNPRRRARRSR